MYGFYGHAGNSYASTSPSEASSFLSSEVEAVNSAAEVAKAVLSGLPNTEAYKQPFVLSVGSTPTAHAASAETRALLSRELHGILELHAGACIPFESVGYHNETVERELPGVGLATAVHWDDR